MGPLIGRLVAGAFSGYRTVTVVRATGRRRIMSLVRGLRKERRKCSLRAESVLSPVVSLLSNRFHLNVRKSSEGNDALLRICGGGNGGTEKLSQS